MRIERTFTADIAQADARRRAEAHLRDHGYHRVQDDNDVVFKRGTVLGSLLGLTAAQSAVTVRLDERPLHPVEPLAAILEVNAIGRILTGGERRYWERQMMELQIAMGDTPLTDANADAASEYAERVHPDRLAGQLPWRAEDGPKLQPDFQSLRARARGSVPLISSAVLQKLTPANSLTASSLSAPLSASPSSAPVNRDVLFGLIAATALIGLVLGAWITRSTLGAGFGLLFGLGAGFIAAGLWQSSKEGDTDENLARLLHTPSEDTNESLTTHSE